MTTGKLPVLIIGGGFSGAMLAARLAEKGRASLIIEQEGTVGLGAAYGTEQDAHRLNVRAANMGALADDPAHFLKWLEQHHREMADGDAFISRRIYGDYVHARLAGVMQDHKDRIGIARGRAVSIEGQAVILHDDRRLEGSDIVIATGNPAPRRAAEASRSISDPWAKGALDAIKPEDDLFILGTSLTMADVLLGLLKRGWKGRATALSRRGLLPRPHMQGHPPAPRMPQDALSGPLSQRLHIARQMARQTEWQRVMDGYRSQTARLWQEASTQERARFLRHLRPWWDVHRHRIAPDVHETLQKLRKDKRLIVRSGRLGSVSEAEDGLKINWKPSPRSTDETCEAHADWFINCTGPAHDVLSTPLTARLVEAGRARLDPLEQGLDLDADARLIGADGQPQPHLFALGPPTRAAYWESTAVPDIRQRIEALSTRLST